MASGPGQAGAARALRGTAAGAAGLNGACRSQGAGEPRRRRFRRAARALAHLCGLTLWRKSCILFSERTTRLNRHFVFDLPHYPPSNPSLECSFDAYKKVAREDGYIGKSPIVQWAIFHLKRRTHLGSDLLFNISDYSTTNLRRDFEKLKRLLYICPKERSQQDLSQIQTCLKKNRTFQCLPNKTQLQLCQAVVYQECEAGTIVIRQAHVPSECYLVLSGKLKVVWGDANFKAQTFTSEILGEAEEGDFIGETCLLSNINRPASIICKSDVELLVINKEDFDCILADFLHEKYRATCNFLRKLTIFSSWPAEEIDFLLHCSLHRFYRTGTTVVPESLNSYFLVVVKSGRCLIVTQLDQKRICAHSNEMQNFSSLCNNFITISSLKEKKDLTRRLWERSIYSATQRIPLTQMPRRPRPQTAAVSCYSLRDRKAFGDLEQKSNEALHLSLIEGLSEKDAETKRGGSKQKVLSSGQTIAKNSGFITSSVPEDKGSGTRWHFCKDVIKCEILITLNFCPYCCENYNDKEQVGLAETMDKFCGPQFSLISEGAECIFIPKKLFLDKAPVKSRKMALELVKSYPTESMIIENYTRHRAWNTYKTKLVRQQLERQARPTSAHFSF